MYDVFTDNKIITMMIIIMIVYEYIHPCSLYHDSRNHDTDCMGVKKNLKKKKNQR